jgi:hypothetical protein
MEFTSETGKIPKGYGYLLKPSVILAALTARDLGGIRVHLVRSHGRRLFDARYRPPDGDIPYERLNIKVGTAHERDLPAGEGRSPSRAGPMDFRSCRARPADGDPAR